MTGAPENREHYSRKCAAFDLWLDNLPTVLEPDRGDPETAERMSAVIDEPAPDATE